jgi:hypothetical protein
LSKKIITKKNISDRGFEPNRYFTSEVPGCSLNVLNLSKACTKEIPGYKQLDEERHSDM